MSRRPRLALVLGLMASWCAVLPASVSAQLTRTVYLNAFDSDGRPVDDLQAEDFVVKEDGKEREIVRVGPAQKVMQIAVIVDDNGTGIFRSGLARFMQRLQGRAEFSLVTVMGQPLKLVDFTLGSQALNDAVVSLSARPGTPDGGQLLQGILDAAREHEKRESARPIILALTVPGEEHSTVPAHYVLAALRDSNAALHVFSVANSSLRQMAAVTRPSALLEENLNLGEVLGDGPKQSGGRRQEIVAAAGVVPGLQALADSLLHQYELQYALPEGVRPSEKLNVSVRRKGLSVRAPSRIPAR